MLVVVSVCLCVVVWRCVCLRICLFAYLRAGFLPSCLLRLALLALIAFLPAFVCLPFACLFACTFACWLALLLACLLCIALPSLPCLALPCLASPRLALPCLALPCLPACLLACPLLFLCLLGCFLGLSLLGSMAYIHTNQPLDEGTNKAERPLEPRPVLFFKHDYTAFKG